MIMRMKVNSNFRLPLNVAEYCYITFTLLFFALNGWAIITRRRRRRRRAAWHARCRTTTEQKFSWYNKKSLNLEVQAMQNSINNNTSEEAECPIRRGNGGSGANGCNIVVYILRNLLIFSYFLLNFHMGFWNLWDFWKNANNKLVK